MTQYRTISATDLKSIEKLNFTLSTSNAPATTTAFDFGGFPYYDAAASKFIRPKSHELSLSDRADRTSHHQTSHDRTFSYNNTASSSQHSLVSYSSRCSSRCSSPPPAAGAPAAVRSPPADARPAPTKAQLHAAAPSLFTSRNSLRSYFHAEELFAHNLARVNHCLTNHAAEFAFDEHLVVWPIAAPASALHQHCLRDKLGAIRRALDDIHALVAHINRTVATQYDASIRLPLKWQTLTNSRRHRHFEHSGLMLDSLQRSKRILSTTIKNDGHALDYAVNDAIELVQDFNQYVEDHALQTNGDTWDLVSDINSNCDTPSNDTASGVQSVIDEIVVAFNEYVVQGQHFCEHAASNDVFTYEMASFDDHLKSCL